MIFCRFFCGRKSGADPTEAAPDQTNRGAGLVKIRASRSRDSACRNGSKRESKACDTTFVAKASSRAAVRVSHHLVRLPRYRTFFFLILPLPGRHTTDRTLAQCRCECPSSSQSCSRQIQFLKVSPEQGSETGEGSTGRSSASDRSSTQSRIM